MSYADQAHEANKIATALILDDHDAEARVAYKLAADLYRLAGSFENAQYMDVCAENCFC